MSEKEIKKTVLNIVTQYINSKKIKVFLFGSRATGHARKWSDYDIALKAAKSIPSHTMALIRADIEESRLPVHVEVVDLRQINKNFKKFALKQAQLWKVS